jgi:pimeloyl-ACP methyl ester carboxylesterase
MRTIFESAQPGSRAPTRILMLPAAYTGPEDFAKAGFAGAARKRSSPVDLAFVETKLQHLTDRTVLRRLRHEVVLPARALGYQEVWLGGISIGGFVALAYAERFPGEVEGLCLLAPYLGNRMVTGEILQAQGVARWEPGELPEDDDERRIWRFIKARCARREGHRPAIHLGYGSEDRFADGHRLMAPAADTVDTVPGGHEWPAWLKLWENFLDRRFGSLSGVIPPDTA